MQARKLLPVFLLLSAGCSAPDNPERLHDTTGMQVGWACAEVPCQVEMLADTFVPTCNPDESPTYGQTFGRFFSLWSTCGTAVLGITGAARHVACSTDADCPDLYYYEDPKSYECVHGLCQNTDTASFPRDRLNRSEVEILCYSDISRSATRSFFDPQVEQITALAEQSCPSDESCAVPPECLQP